MPEYAAGVPMWVDVSSRDLDKTRAFYESLLGWESQVTPDPQAGGYTMFLRNGKMVAGGSPLFSSDQHPAWSTYVHAVDAEATAAKVKDARGKVVVGPMDVMGQGKMAVLQDPTGAHICIWQPLQHQGAELVNEPGSFSWSELYTRDLPTAVEFYEKVFGWESEETDMDQGKYTLFKVDGRPIAGGLSMDQIGLPAEVPPHWLVYFTVENTDQAIAKTKEAGAEVMAGPIPSPMGPLAVLSDTTGAYFGVVQLTQGN